MSMPWTTASCVYRTLSKENREIRFVTVVSNPSSPENIECKLSTFSLTDAPPYKALSYVWGDANETVPITLNGFEVQVTTNLFAALQRLSRKRPGTYFWINALCINQTDTEEKNHQVPLMRIIYQQTEQVLMWLGKAEKDSHLALSMIKKWGQAGLQVDRTLSLQAKRAAALAMIKDPFDKPSWRALTYLFQRQYWKRIWIVQGVTLCEKTMFKCMMCGDEEILSCYLWVAMDFWEELIYGDASTLINMDQEYTIRGSSYILYANRLLLLLNEQDAGNASKQYADRLYDILYYTKRHLASDPRDKVYGVLGLLDEVHPGLRPDYNRSIAQVYMDFVVMHINATGKLSSICSQDNCRLRSDRVPGLPSWVPDLSYQEDHTEHFSGFTFSAAEDSTAKFHFSDDFKALTVCGIITDDIQEIESMGGLMTDSERAKYLRAWVSFAAAHYAQRSHPTGMPWRQAFLRTLMADNSSYGYGKADFKSDEEKGFFFNKIPGFLEYITEALTGNDPSAEDEERKKRCEELFPIEGFYYFERKVAEFVWLTAPEHLDSRVEENRYSTSALTEFWGQPGTKSFIDFSNFTLMGMMMPGKRKQLQAFQVNFSSLCAERKLFFTKGGYIGLAPMAVEKGDRVCVLLGCNVPLIIRRQGDHYLIVGDTYVYGIMNGEVVQGVRDENLEYVDLTFR